MVKYPKTFDPEVDVLVRLMNRIEGVFPAASCGGHENNSQFQAAKGDFFIIVAIKNTKFLEYLKNLVEDSEGQMCFEFNPLYETWCIMGFTFHIPILEEDAIYWTDNFGEKDPSEWCMFRSYGGKPERL